LHSFISARWLSANSVSRSNSFVFGCQHPGHNIANALDQRSDVAKWAQPFADLDGSNGDAADVMLICGLRLPASFNVAT
jgi:hypothetical protein